MKITHITLSIALSNILMAENTTSSLEMVTVTANKVEENILYVPQTITVLDENTIKNREIKTVEDIIQEIPNTNITPGFNKSVNFRGLNASDLSLSNPIVIYIDDVPITSNEIAQISLANIEKIEVLRGPQGTIYGKNSIGGVIKITTKKDADVTSGAIDVQYGSDNYKYTSFNINSPLIKNKLIAGINGSIEKDDSWVTNQYQNMDKNYNKKFNTYAKYMANDDLTFRLSYTNDTEEQSAEGRVQKAPGTDIGNFSREDAQNINVDVPSLNKSINKLYSFNMGYEMDEIVFNSVTTFRDSVMDNIYDADMNVQSGLYQRGYYEEDELTQELRLSNMKNTNQVKWTAGLYTDKSSIDQGPYGQQFPGGDGNNYWWGVDGKIDSSSEAIFGQAMIGLDEDLELTIGGRYQKITKEIDSKTFYHVIGSPSDPFYKLKDKKSWNQFLPKVALNYKINENFSSYASVSKGYMSGGYNVFSGSGTVEDNSFDPQKSINYELGLKSTLENLIFNASIFRMDIEDIHVYRVLNGSYLTDNGKKAHSQGLEIDFSYFPNDTLEISGSAGIIQAKYDDFDNGTKKLDSEKIQNTPSHTANLSVVYNHPSGFYSIVNAKNNGAQYFLDSTTSEMIKGDSVMLVDFKTGYKYKNYDFYFMIENVTDEAYINNFYSSSESTIAQFNDPRKFYAGVKYAF